ncbi:MAG: FtsK/SpoIIIE domain-containing protein, partial [Anaerolineae bacterium]
AAPVGILSGGATPTLNYPAAPGGGDGSHAMVGGTTGTGKTRFLQTMVTLLAAHHHPHDLNFVLIDYKGGDLLKGLEDLPHVVGTLANLEKADAQAVLVERLFVCLEAELLRRRNLLGGRDINAYQRDLQQGRETEPLPHLFVVIDEFAEMIRNSPDKAAMTKRLLSIGATGRSLGVHLILATQDPSGVVTDELRNNINIRLCLRMGSRDASMALLRLPDAFENITTAQVGRAILQVGNNDRFVPFQVAWGGDRYTPGQAAPSAEIYQVGLDGKRTPLRSFRPLQAAEETQLGAMVRHIRETADRLGLSRLRSPISPPLRDTVFLDEVRAGEPGWNGQTWEVRPGAPWLAPIVGQSDDPTAQAQPPLRLPLGTEGHFALFGEPGSGKTTFIQTLVTSLALAHSPEEVHIYLVDVSSQRLVPLKGFPHVGDVFSGDEVDRLRRFFRYLTRELQARKAEFARAGAARLPDYRTLTGKPLPAIVVVLRDYDAFYRLAQDRDP